MGNVPVSILALKEYPLELGLNLHKVIVTPDDGALILGTRRIDGASCGWITLLDSRLQVVWEYTSKSSNFNDAYALEDGFLVVGRKWQKSVIGSDEHPTVFWFDRAGKLARELLLHTRDGGSIERISPFSDGFFLSGYQYEPYNAGGHTEFDYLPWQICLSPSGETFHPVWQDPSITAEWLFESQVAADHHQPLNYRLAVFRRQISLLDKTKPNKKDADSFQDSCHANYIQLDPDRGLLFQGYSEVSRNGDCSYRSAWWLAKYSSRGKLVWQKIFDFGGNYGSASKSFFLPDGNILTFGYVNFQYRGHPLIALISESGNLEKTWHWGAEAIHSGSAICLRSLFRPKRKVDTIDAARRKDGCFLLASEEKPTAGTHHDIPRSLRIALVGP